MWTMHVSPNQVTVIINICHTTGQSGKQDDQSCSKIGKATTGRESDEV